MAKKASSRSAKSAAPTGASTTAKADAPAAPASGSSRGRGRSRGPSRGLGYVAGAAKGKSLVIVESPSKAKTINKYLGRDYVVLASIGHVRDLPSKNPKGVKSPVPGVDLEHRFNPTYEILPGKEKVIADLKRAAKDADQVWFATDLDREGEAIAWHLAQELQIPSDKARRGVFAALTKSEIDRAFGNPHPIDEDRVNAQQARRILDRIVGYQVSPMLWKKVARGLSAGRVQSVAVRLVVEREREIRAFIPDENWEIHADLALSEPKARELGPQYDAFAQSKDEKGNPPSIKSQVSWLSERSCIRAELVEVDEAKFDLCTPGPGDQARFARPTPWAPVERACWIATAAGLTQVKGDITDDPKGRGPARWIRTVRGNASPATPYTVTSIETERRSQRPPGPFITSTLQQAASSRLGFGAQRTMRAAQQLYEGVDVPGEGPVGLITYMRTDSTHLSGDALQMARDYIGKSFGPKYLPEKPNFFASSNKGAQEAHEAIRPTNLNYPPSRVAGALTPDQLRLYTLIWNRFVACQMAHAQWDATTVLLSAGGGANQPTLTFRAGGRTLVFDGYLKVAGVPHDDDEQTLPPLKQGQVLNPLGVRVEQKFTSPPPRYSEASLIKTLEKEGIGRPSTYASIIGVIQDRKYVEQLQRRFHATDLGEVVTDKLVEGFPEIMDIGYTREMESLLDKIEEDHLDWIKMLQDFYGPFQKSLKNALTTLTHAKAETVPAPKEYRCAKCNSDLVYRFGKNGRFLSCSRYPDCDYASPVDREGKPRPAAEGVNVACPKCGSAMTKRTGRFGVFLSCTRYGDKSSPCTGILNLDRKGKVQAPSPPPLVTDLPCPTCQSPMNLRNGVRGPWLGCSRFPKCRGRGKGAEVPEARRKEREAALAQHDKANPVAIIRTLDGKALTDAKGKALNDAPTIDQLSQDGQAPDDAAPVEVGGNDEAA